jgi:hypothetical protein
MKLTFVHQILIASSIGLCAIFGLRSIVIGARTGSGLSIGLGLASLVALAGLALYLRRFRAKLAAKETKSGAL